MEFAILIAGYLIGSIPFGLLIARWFGKMDIRKFGSGNIGATNVGRAMGFRWFIVVFLFDALKGLLPTLVAKLMFAEETGFWHIHGATLVGAATIVGHMFPCYLKFRGGKGVATGLGVVFVLAPLASLIAGVGFGLATLIWRTVSISSILAAAMFCIVELCLLKPHPFTTDNIALALFSILIPGLIIYRHRSNIVRIFQGSEEAIGEPPREKKPKEQSP